MTKKGQRHKETLTREPLSSGFVNNKGADQPAHPRSLISAFAVRSLGRTVFKQFEFSIKISVAEQPDLSMTW